MKEFFKKHDLIKVTGIMVFITALLTWIVKIGSFDGSEVVVQEITRIGFKDFMLAGILILQNFTVLITFLFILGGFYQLLSKRAGYQALVKKISEKLKGHATIVVLITSLVFALAGSFMNEYLPLFVVIPFVITILNRMKVDKISAFSATFGGLLVGTIGSIYSAKVAGYINAALGTTVETMLWTKIVLFLVAYILISLFTVLRMRKTKGNKKFEDYDKFEVETAEPKEGKARKWPYVVGLILIFVSTVMGYLPWTEWGITVFNDVTTWVNELSLFGVPIISYIFADFKAFGSWDLVGVQYIMLFATVLIHWIGRVSWNELLESYSEGFKKISSTVFVMVLVYLVLELSAFFPVMPTIVDGIVGLANGFNAGLTSLAMFITSIFAVEPQYLMNFAGSYLAATYSSSKEVIAVITQSVYGLASFFVPTSAILMIGLSYLGISYKDWLKHIWKFVLAMLIVVAIIILIVAL